MTAALQDSVIAILAEYDIIGLGGGSPTDGQVIKYNDALGYPTWQDDISDSGSGSWTIVKVDTTIKFADGADAAIIQIHDDNDSTEISYAGNSRLWFKGRINVVDAVSSDTVIADTVLTTNLEADTVRVTDSLSVDGVLDMVYNQIYNVASATADSNAVNLGQTEGLIGDTAALRVLIANGDSGLIKADTLWIGDEDGDTLFAISPSAGLIYNATNGGRVGFDSVYVDSGGSILFYDSDRGNNVEISYAVLDSMVNATGRFAATSGGIFTELDDSNAYWSAGGLDSALGLHSDGDGSITTITAGNNDTLQLGVEGLTTTDSLKVNDSLSMEGNEIMNVAHGTVDTAAANVGQLEDSVGAVRAEIGDSADVVRGEIPDSVAANTAGDVDTSGTDIAAALDNATSDAQASIRDTTGIIAPGTAPTTDAAGEMAFDTDDTAIEVYSGAASHLLPLVQGTHGIVVEPDQVNDTVDIFLCSPYSEPHGILLRSIEMVANDSAGTYALEFEEWSNTGARSRAGYIDTVEVPNDSAYMASASFSDADIAVNNSIRVIIPSTDIDNIYFKLTYFIKEGD
jgi:hypothetical protein